MTWTRDELLAEWVHVRPNCTFDEFPGRIGITADAWQKAWQRARAARDPRAVYGDIEWVRGRLAHPYTGRLAEANLRVRA